MNATQRAETLNRECACESPALEPDSGFYANVPVFVGVAQVLEMQALIAAITRVTALPGWSEAVLRTAPAIARIETSARGVFHGFDFHIADQGPRLIEINTNAGGAMINAIAGWRHPWCCNGSNPSVRIPPSRAELESSFFAMFRNEWQLFGAARPLRHIAIVDHRPEQQFLYPEFRAFAALFARAGISVDIADAAELRFIDGQLLHDGRVVDLVYNRLTDFYFEDPRHEALRLAYESQVVLVTPHPRAHALLADKHNLARFTDADFLRDVGADQLDIEVLKAGVPATRRVTGCEATWWQERKQWFFKPRAGYGSRGAYRGDKLTRRVMAEVLNGDYVAQRLALPGERLRANASGSGHLKVDLRAYVYDGQAQLLAARLYQGQTTNFRTAGGGFAPVLELQEP